jgi:hypothetical protein
LLAGASPPHRLTLFHQDGGLTARGGVVAVFVVVVVVVVVVAVRVRGGLVACGCESVDLTGGDGVIETNTRPGRDTEVEGPPPAAAWTGPRDEDEFEPASPRPVPFCES